MVDKILQFDVAKLVKYSSIDEENKILLANDVDYEKFLLRKKGKKLLRGQYTSLLFDQMQKALYKNEDYVTDLSSIFYILDFSNCRNREYNILSICENGIKIKLDGKEITLIEFFKSSSMSRESKVYYINKDFYPLIKDRITFGLDENDFKLDLSKWYAYTGLTITDCHLINDIKFNADEVVIVEDKERIIKTDCLTAISGPSLLDEISQLRDLIKKDEVLDINKNAKIRIIFDKFNCFNDSGDFDLLSDQLKDIIKTVLDVNKSIEEYKDSLANLVQKYMYFNNMGTNVKWEKVNLKQFPVSVNYYDGEGLISLELDEQINNSLIGNDMNMENEDDNNDIDFVDEDYKGSSISHSFQIRLPFIKGVVHSCDLKKFFKNHNIIKIYGKTYNGDNKREYDVNKVKMILTESQFKLAKFIKNLKTVGDEEPIDAYFRLLNEYNYSFGISNIESYSKVDYVKLCYQFFSTMPISEYESNEFVKVNQTYLNEITDNDYVINSIRASDSAYNNLLEIYDVSKEFAYSTRQFKDIKRNLLNKERENYMVSKMNVRGTRKFLSSDLLGLLYYIIDEEYDSDLSTNEMYVPNTNYPNNKFPMVLLRNPHYSRNEIKMLWATEGSIERNEIFGHLTGVCMTNPTSLTAMRLGGADYDGDSIIITWQYGLTNALYANLYRKDKEIYPLVVIPSIKSNPVSNNHENRIRCFKNTFKSFVGTISDQCFIKSFEAYKKGDYDSIAFYTILNGLEIDSAKNGRKPLIPVLNTGKNNKISKETIEATDFINLKNYKKKDKNVKNLIERISHYNGVFFDNVNAFNKYKIKNQDVVSPIIKENKEIDADNAINLASIVNTYSLFRAAVKSFKECLHNHSIDNVEELLNQLNEVLDNKNIDIDTDDLFNSLYSSNPYETLSNYIKDSVFYINDDDLKDISLIGLGLDNIPNYIKDIIFDYEDEGFKILYLILYYNKERMKTVSFKKNYFNSSLKKINLRKLNKNYMDIIISKTNSMSESLKDIIDETLNGNSLDLHNVNNIVEKIDLYFENKVRDYSINDLAYVCNVYNSSITLNLFKDRLKDELLDMKKEGK